MIGYGDYRKERAKVGEEFQDFVVQCCWNQLKLAVIQFTSKKYQYIVGESLSGVEIKFDDKYAKTGNLWIEVGEKAEPRPGDYAPAGIKRNDNTWLYVIGDYSTIFVFPKNLLRQLFATGRYELRENGTGTSQGFLLPDSDAQKYSAIVLHSEGTPQ